jgi:hypothetical protein
MQLVINILIIVIGMFGCTASNPRCDIVPGVQVSIKDAPFLFAYYIVILIYIYIYIY